jgi:fructokinase
MGSPDDVRSQMESILALSDVVKASDEDIHWLYPTLTLPQVVAHWHSLGPDIVVITRGAEGVFASTRAHRITLPTRATRVVDTIGAGDSFMAGMLHALAEGGFLGGEARSARVALSEEQLTRVISSGLTCAAVTVSRAGANPPTLSELAKVG